MLGRSLGAHGTYWTSEDVMHFIMMRLDISQQDPATNAAPDQAS